MHIGILQTGHVPDTLIPANGNYDAIFMSFLANRGLTFTNYAVVDDIFPASVQEAEGWLITGSRHGAYEAHSWIPPLEGFVRDAKAQKIPMVGICFGHQIIAQALGGKVEKYAGGWAVGRQSYDFDGLGQVALNAWHQDQVTERPQGAQVIARNDFCENAALIYGDDILTMQPHPEIRRQYLKGLLEERGPGVVPDAILQKATADLDAPVAEDALAKMITDFFTKARGKNV